MKASLFTDEAWEIARKVAAIDGQLLSIQAVEAFAALAALAEQRAALRCAGIAEGHVPFLNDGIDGKLIATAIRREFGLSTSESSPASTTQYRRELADQIEKWRHLTGSDKSGDRFHHLGCGKGALCPADGYLGDDWLISHLLDAIPSTPEGK